MPASSKVEKKLYITPPYCPVCEDVKYQPIGIVLHTACTLHSNILFVYLFSLFYYSSLLCPTMFYILSLPFYYYISRSNNPSSLYYYLVLLQYSFSLCPTISFYYSFSLCPTILFYHSFSLCPTILFYHSFLSESYYLVLSFLPLSVLLSCSTIPSSLCPTILL